MTAKDEIILKCNEPDAFLRVEAALLTAPDHKHCTVRIENDTDECKRGDFAMIDLEAAVSVGDIVLVNIEGIAFLMTIRRLELTDHGYVLNPLKGSRSLPMFVKDWTPYVIGRVDKFLGARDVA
jgi:SOS-response transcriptional repressor LexA